MNQYTGKHYGQAFIVRRNAKIGKNWDLPAHPGIPGRGFGPSQKLAEVLENGMERANKGFANFTSIKHRICKYWESI